MDAYHELAKSYDRLTNDVDYEATVEFYMQILEKEGVKPRTVVDLACGTGSVTEILARKGYQVTGVDMSEEMLTEAMAKVMDMENPPRFVCQKLQELHLPRGVDLAVCALDSLDYITDPENCREAIRRVYKALNPGGIFIFDVNTPEKLRAIETISKLHMSVARTEQYIEQRLSALQSTPPRKRPTFILKDVRLFLNSLDRGLKLVRSAGVDAEYDRQETEETILNR